MAGTAVAKPANHKWLRDDHEAAEFMRSLKLRDIPGVGWRSLPKIVEAFGEVELVGDLIVKAGVLQTLKALLGDVKGATLYGHLRGEDHSPVENKPRQSFSADMSYGVRTLVLADVKSFIGELCGQLVDSVHRAGYRADKLTLKLWRAKDSQFEAGCVT
jgi:nucleotidyltransferase/DNA polymerase involved in DNA repair